MANTMHGALAPNPIEETLRSVVDEARMRSVSIKDGLVHQCAQHIFYDAQNWGGDPAGVPDYIQGNVLAAAELIDGIKLFPPGAVEAIMGLIYRKLAQQTSSFISWDAYGNWTGWRYTEDESRTWRDGRGRIEYRDDGGTSSFFGE